MKTETADVVIAAAKVTPGLLGTALTMDALIAVATFVFLVLQVAYLIRKWWREETEWGLKIRRWAERHGITRPASLEPDD
ncbi:hypothetical protein [Pseudorhodoferax sp.]|uniref:hypothetical protein n=1 Tax=Pseudorhodoferax sp. TaxID=1993553 RepID=UPI0039E4A1BB